MTQHTPTAATNAEEHGDRSDGPDRPTPDASTRASARGHLAFGWCCLLVFMGLGAVLEGLHSLKLGFYLDSSNAMRRLLWTLAHAHGTLFGLVHIAFAVSLPQLSAMTGRSRGLASRCLYGGTIVMPVGFFLGGVFVFEGDPGLPVLLAPLGAALLFIAVGLIARATLAGDG